MLEDLEIQDNKPKTQKQKLNLKQGESINGKKTYETHIKLVRTKDWIEKNRFCVIELAETKDPLNRPATETIKAQLLQNKLCDHTDLLKLENNQLKTN